MKQLLFFCAITVAVFAGCVDVEKQAPPEQEQSVSSYQVFYNELSPYGRWIEHPNYGYVWIPGEDQSSFFPYGSNGYWVFSDDGWTWVSNYKWGWAPFHYGRWGYEAAYGWYWVPDGVWGPAWVCWDEAPGYYGWAPMGPGISVAFVAGGGYHPSNDWWMFCDQRHFGDHNIGNYYEPREHIGRIIGESRTINETTLDHSRNTRYMNGPDKNDVGRAVGMPVQQYHITERQAPGETLDNQNVRVYRPIVQSQTPSEPKPLPKTIENKGNIPHAPETPVMPANTGSAVHYAPPPEQRESQPANANEHRQSEPVRVQHAAPAPRQSAPAQRQSAPARSAQPAAHQQETPHK